MNRVLIVGVTIALLALLAGGVVWAAESGTLTQLPGRQTESAVEDEAAEAVRLGRLSDNIVHGTVTAVEKDRVLIATEDDASVTLIITGTTLQWVPGRPPTRTIELAVDDPVLAFGRPVTGSDGEKALLAQIIIVAKDEDLHKYVIRGQVVVATQRTIVVDTGLRERAVTVLPRTRFFSPARPDAPRDVRAGDAVVALGQPTELGQWIAGVVVVPGAGQLAGRRLIGQVTAIDMDGGTLTVQVGRRGEVTLVTGDDTSYRIRDVEEPELTDIKVGDRILATGRFEAVSQTRFLARLIAVLPVSQ